MNSVQLKERNPRSGVNVTTMKPPDDNGQGHLTPSHIRGHCGRVAYWNKNRVSSRDSIRTNEIIPRSGLEIFRKKVLWLSKVALEKNFIHSIHDRRCPRRIQNEKLKGQSFNLPVPAESQTLPGEPMGILMQEAKRD
ncbi:hypothetical protein HJG60_010642 [Phyllostomus discolor]|uniref:Uncharacterized protein n=1 Tax=Phyllostomus discolor TaxID=89673 RepID=A0A834AHT5_9CHIR|nr:hypothetical protein HJG60_010642 [Phyllostomus discolor]